MVVDRTMSTKMHHERRSYGATAHTRTAQMMRAHQAILGKGGARLGAAARRTRAPHVPRISDRARISRSSKRA